VDNLSSLSKRSQGLVLLILLMVPSLLSDVPFMYGQTSLGPPTEFKPEIEFSKWDNEVWMKVEYVSPESLTTISLEDDKMIWKGDTQEVAYYLLPSSDQYDEGYEYEVILKEQPLSNVFTFKIDTENLVFYYQPPLNEEIMEKGWTVNETHAFDENGILRSYRPENVVSSYAVYHSSKRDNEYKTGKAFHIFRPEAIDSKGNRVWCDLNIDVNNSILTITVPILFLHTLNYPIILDPSVGYTTKGGSSNECKNYIYYCNATLSETGTIQNITVYLNDFGGIDANISYAIYNSTGSFSTKTVEFELTGLINDWKTLDITSPPTLSAQNIRLALWWSDWVKYFYDAGSLNQVGKLARVYDYSSWPDPVDFAQGFENVTISIYANYTVTGGNNAPGADASSIENMDDGDNVYSQLRDYNLILNVSEADGIAELDFIQYALEIGSGWVNGTIDAQSNAHTFQAGSTNCTVGAVTNVTTATTANYTVPIKTDWDIISASDNDIHLWVNDTVGANSGWSEIKTDYFDTVNDLVTNAIECTDGNNPDRVDISSSIQIDFTVRYENDPSSGVATTFYPPDAEFTSISVYDSANNNEGTDNSIVNGAGSVTFNAPAAVGSDTYNLYIDMADADYSDGEETTTETVITDRIVAYSEALDDTRVDINANIEWRIKAVLDYDDHPLGAGDGVSCSWGALAWDAGNSWFDISHSEATVQGVTITLTTGSEATYGITSFSENITETTGIYDRIMVYDEALNDSRVNLNDVIEGRYNAVLDYDDHDLGAGDQLNCSWGALAWDAGNSWFEITNTSAAVTGVTVGGWTGSEATHGITAIAENITETTWIWDQAVVYYFVMDDTRVDINTNAEDRIRFVLDYDDHAGGAGDTLNVNGSAAAWDAGNGWFENITSVNAIVNYTFVVTTVSEATYGITSYTVNVSNPWCVWDRVNVTLSVPDTRVNVSGSANIGESAVYAFDGGAHAGTITLNDTEIQAAVGNYTYTVSSITDANYGLTAFLSNDVWCVFDQQQLQTLGVNNSTPAANENVTIWATAQSPFDAHVLGAGDTLVLEDTDANTYTMSYNGSHWVWVGSWPANGTITLNTYSSVNETTYIITTLDMNSLSLVITVGTSPPPSGNTFDLQVITSDGVGIQNANVRLYNSSGDLFSVNTNSTGQITQQTFDSGNYTLTILREGYTTYNHTYSWTTDVELIVALTVDAELAGMGILPLLLGFMGLVVLMAANRRR